MDLDRFSRPTSWEKPQQSQDLDEIEEYKLRRDLELEDGGNEDG